MHHFTSFPVILNVCKFPFSILCCQYSQQIKPSFSHSAREKSRPRLGRNQGLPFSSFSYHQCGILSRAVLCCPEPFGFYWIWGATVVKAATSLPPSIVKPLSIPKLALALSWWTVPVTWQTNKERWPDMTFSGKPTDQILHLVCHPVNLL